MEKLFNPAKVAVVGVSPAEDNLGRFIMWNLINHGFAGEIVPFGRREGCVYGHRIRSLKDVPSGIDVACVLVPVSRVLEVVKLFHDVSGTRRFVVYTGGFSEYGEEGERIERELKSYALERGILLVGPNCLGVMNFSSGFVTPFAKIEHRVIKGRISVISQSGGVASSYINALSEEGLGLSKVVSIGNKLVLDECHYIDFLADDPETDLIICYLEDVKNGRRFYESLKRCRKPVIVHKANVSEAARRIARFHTAALTTKDELVTAAIKQAGKIRVRSQEEAVLAAKALQLPRLKGRALAVVSRSGGEGVILADAAALNGFELPEYPKDILDFVCSKARAKVIRPTNPLDLGDLYEMPAYAEVVERIAQKDTFGGIVFATQFYAHEWDYAEELLRRIADISKRYNKPITVFIGGDRSKLDEKKALSIYPIFNSPESAVKAMTYLL